MTARASLTGNWASSAAIAFLLSLITLGAVYLSWLFASGMRGNTYMKIATFLVVLIIVLLLSLFEAGAAYFFLKLSRTHKAEIKDILFAFREHPDRILINGFIYIGAFLVYAVPYYIAFFTGNGKITLPVPFLIIWGIAGAAVLAYFLLTFSQFVFILLDEPDCGAIESLKKSAALMKGNKWRFLKMLFSFIGWYCLNLLSGGIGMLWIKPYFTETLSLFYRGLRDDFSV